MNELIVLGSINNDTIVRVKKLPKPGETIHSYEVFTSGGGKGANQAIAAQRNSAKTHFIGSVGNDESGKMLVDLLKQDGVDTKGISTIDNDRTGSAIVLVNDEAENSIIINGNANKSVFLSESSMQIFDNDIDFLISQFEINIDVIIEAFKLARKKGIKTILNPAPAMNRIPDDLLYYTDILIPNKNEAEMLTGIKINSDDQLPKVAKELKKFNVELVIITLGSKGSYFYNGNEYGKILSQKVTAIDTTGAGDTFIGSFAAKLKKDYSNLIDAISYATYASAITVQRFGAQPSIPYANEVNNKLNKN